MKGLTSKQHLFARVLLVVAIADTVIFYTLLRKSQLVTWQFAFLATVMTLVALTVNLQFWWRLEVRSSDGASLDASQEKK